jgi:signal transduction histidine kinase
MDSVDERPRRLVARTAREGADNARLDVQHVGTGLDPALSDKLFEPFYAIKPESLGVGLSVSRSIVELHSSQLWAAPDDGPGANFPFSLPRAIEQAQPIR